MKKTLALLALMAGGTSAVWAETDIMSGVFTAEQAERGAQIYADSCASCHGAELVSSDAEAPSFTGFTFNLNWGNKTLAERFERIHTTMPLDAPGSLEDQAYLDVIAYILSFNNYPSGDTELTSASDLEGTEIIKLP